MKMNISAMTKNEIADIIRENINGPSEDIVKLAFDERVKHYGKKVYFRGLIEFTNYCKNDCYYCGIRSKNKNALRYRLTKEEILKCCEEGRKLGFSTFVLQGGEDLYFDEKRMCDIIYSIKST